MAQTGQRFKELALPLPIQCADADDLAAADAEGDIVEIGAVAQTMNGQDLFCLLYTSDAADE